MAQPALQVLLGSVVVTAQSPMEALTEETQMVLTTANPMTSALAEHATDTGHNINWSDAQVISLSSDVVSWRVGTSADNPSP